MGKIVLLVSREEMLYQAHNILQEKKYPIGEMKVIQTENAVTEARQAIGGGATIIIARGLQASLIKQYTDIPVVEIVLTAQEMALLVVRAKQIAKKPRPAIAVVGFKNMFSDMSYFDELYDIELRTYLADQGNHLSDMAKKAMDEGADVIIGGDTTVAMASAGGFPSLFLSMTEDSMRNAFSMAQSMDYAMSVEKRTAAQMETLLDYSYNGVVHLDRDGKITAVNLLAEELLGQSQEKLRGHAASEVVEELRGDALHQALSDGREYTFFLERNHASMFAVLAPVLYEGRPDGAIMTLRRMKKQTGGSTREEEEKRKQKSKGLPPLTRFDDILQNSLGMQECVRLAKLYALSEQPVVIVGEPGTEKRMLAQSIHNGSVHRSGPFLDVPCEGLSEEEQREYIFGDRGAAVQAQGGTLLIQDIQALTPANQYRLHQLIRHHICHGQEIAQLRKINVRIMVTLRKPLAEIWRAGGLRQDLFYVLSGLEILVPPLRKRPEDLNQKLSDTLRECCDRYSRYHVLTDGAKKELLSYSWDGNLFQIDSFFERLILTAEHRSIDEVAVKRLLRELYPEAEEVQKRVSGGTLGSDEKGWKESIVISSEGQRIAEMLTYYNGSREKTAAALGISKATLWRKMKKYELE